MISTHILDLSSGRPALGVAVVLEKLEGKDWKMLQMTATDKDGRIQFHISHEMGTYRLNFNIEEYFKSQGKESFFVMAPVIFSISDSTRKYHVPLLLSNFGYSTYRGS